MSLLARASADNEVVQPALSQAVGYVVVVLVGLIIAFSPLILFKHFAINMLTGCAVMMFVTRVLKKTVGEDNAKTEMWVDFRPLSSHPLLTNSRFMTANRNVRTGLTASAVISVC